MPIYQISSALNNAPQAAVRNVPPKVRPVNGVASDILGIVGIASWGPVNSPVLPSAIFGGFGYPGVRKYDLASALAISSLVGASNVRAVRVTDGTDTAATAALLDAATPTPATGATLTAIYTGTVGNTLQAAISAGTKQGTYKLTITLPGYTPEIFDNIAGTGATFWANLVSAVNNGQSGIRGPSQLAVATVGASTAAPNTATTYTLSGGTDGTTTLTDAVLVGTDGTSTQRKGMYALRGTGAQVLNLVDLTDSTQYSAINAFALGEGMYAITQGAAGASYSTVSTNLNTAAVDSYAMKVLVGDWDYWQDNYNGQLRMMAPATFLAAEIAALQPHLSSLNKQIPAIVSSQRVMANQPYSSDEISAIVGARLDLITNPSPGGNYYGSQTGRNVSSNPATNGDNYTRMWNYLALTLASSFGWVVGELQTVDLRTEAQASMDNFLSTLEGQGMIGDVNGGPAFSIIIDASNNPDARVAQGYLQADVQVKFLSVVFQFLVNLEGGQTVSIQPKQ